jgi:hypothetical protein
VAAVHSLLLPTNVTPSPFLLQASMGLVSVELLQLLLLLLLLLLQRPLFPHPVPASPHLLQASTGSQLGCFCFCCCCCCTPTARAHLLQASTG